MGDKKPMRCFVCDGERWLEARDMVDGKEAPVHSESKVQVCLDCGNACHEVDVSKEAEVKDYYRKEYRPKPTVMNLVTTTHKINYIRVFLMDYLKSLGDRKLVVGDVGAATGYVLNFFRQMGHRVSGSELTLTFRRMSEHYYGIPLAEELETKHRYDLIVVYHVLEHLYEPDRKLAHYASLLADGGRMLVATPEWFDVLEEASGTPTNSFDNLFHKNHVNLFSKTSLQNIFRKAGLAVVKEDHRQYGQTYLLEKREAGGQWLTKEDPRDVLRVMLNHRRAIGLHSAGRHRDATEVEPRYPEAWIAQIFGKTSKDQAKQADLFAQAKKHMGGNGRMLLAEANWLYQQGRLRESVAALNEVLSFKPNEDTLMFLGYAHSQLGQVREAIQAFQTAQAMDPRKWAEAQSWILNAVGNMPTWDERGRAEAMKLLAQSQGAQPAAGVPQ